MKLKFNLKKNLFALVLASVAFAACERDDPAQEEPLEEVGRIAFSLKEVSAEAHGDHYHYHDDVEDPFEVNISFTESTINGREVLVPSPDHLHLTQGKSYRFQLTSYNFLGIENTQTFVDAHEIHYAFLGEFPAGSVHIEYADETSDGQAVKVGTTGYITVLEHTGDEHFDFTYLLKHLNPGIKNSINTSTDWASDPNNFAGSTDIQFQIEMGLDAEGDHGHGHDHDHGHDDHGHNH